jgi:hypothetical protein
MLEAGERRCDGAVYLGVPRQAEIIADVTSARSLRFAFC